MVTLWKWLKKKWPKKESFKVKKKNMRQKYAQFWKQKLYNEKNMHSFKGFLMESTSDSGSFEMVTRSRTKLFTEWPYNLSSWENTLGGERNSPQSRNSIPTLTFIAIFHHCHLMFLLFVICLLHICLFVCLYKKNYIPLDCNKTLK